MRLLDEKGNLFGRINLIDLFLIIFIIVSFTLLAISYGRFEMRKYRVEEVFVVKDLTMTLDALLVPEEIVNAMKAGEKDIRGASECYMVLESFKSTPARINSDKQGLSPLESAAERYRNVEMIFKVRVRQRGGEYFYASNRIKLHSKMDFCASTYEVEGTILQIKVDE